MSSGAGRHKSIRQALEFVERNPEWPTGSRLEMPVWELVARNLFDHATNPDSSRIAQARRTRAQKILLTRLTGTRRTGTAPAVRNEKEVKIADFTAGLPASTPVQDTEEETVHVSIIL